jgi:predicted outer membrane protein
MSKLTGTPWITAAAGVLVGIAIGAGAVYSTRGERAGEASDPFAADAVVVRDIVDVPTMPAAEAETHRADRYARITTIEATLSLPGDFAQTEALYVLAGRSGSAAVQDLIDQANRIADPTDREAALSILFLRLAELDPQSALTMSRMRAYTSSRSLEGNIWRTWSKLDLDAALAAANRLSNPADKQFAAQVMLAAHGYTGNDKTERIERELGVRPNAQSRARHIISIADRSVPEAFDAIYALPLAERQQAMQTLANYLGQRNPSQAIGYADLIDDAGLRRTFRSTVSLAVARRDPERVLAGMPPGSLQGEQAGQYYTAMQTLASTDVDKALAYYERIDSPQVRQAMAGLITAELIRVDPARALDWARSQDRGGRRLLEMSALTQIAGVDPALALQELSAIPRGDSRQMLSSVLSTVARVDPQLALGYLGDIVNAQDRQLAASSIINGWANVDPEAAMNWLISSDLPQAGSLLTQTGYAIIGRDVDAAIRMLPRLDERTAEQWGTQIAATLASQRSPEAALQFVERFRGKAGYEQMQSALVGSLAQSDIGRARELVERMAPGVARDRGIERLIMVEASQTPAQAAALLDSIGSEQVRAEAAGSLASQWIHRDPAAAMQWLSAQPAGRVRDQIIGQIASARPDSSADIDRLINTMSDPQLQTQARIMRVYTLAQSDPVRARTILESLDLPDAQRRQLETQLDEFARMRGQF